MSTMLRVAVFLFCCCMVPVLLHAQPAGLQQKAGEELVRKNNFIRVYVSSKQVVEGEAVIVTYKSYCRVAAELEIRRHPEFKGCSVNDFYRDENDQPEKIAGNWYQVNTLRRLELIPLQAGKLRIEPIVVENKLFDQRGNAIIVNIESPVTDVQVNPLPAGAPAGFSGAVGTFKVMARWENDTIGAGENNHLQIVVSGTGNLQTIGLPVITWPAGMEHYEPAEHTENNNHLSPIEYTHMFRVPVVVKQPGAYAVPPVQFIFYNTTTRTYETIAAAVPGERLLVTESRKDVPLRASTSNTVFLWIVAGIAVAAVAGGILYSKQEQKKQLRMQEQAVAEQQALLQELAAKQQAVKQRLDAEALQRELEELETVETDKAYFTAAWGLLGKIAAYRYAATVGEDALTVLRRSNAPAEAIAGALLVQAAYHQSAYSFSTTSVARQEVRDVLNHYRQLI